MAVTAQYVLDVAESYLWIGMGSAQHKALVDAYNMVKPVPVGYPVKYSDDWCDLFVTVIGDKTGAAKLYGRECGVDRHIQIFKKLGIWIEDGTVKPKAGDIITFNWDKFGQPNDDFADHIGFVEKVVGNIIYTIEGNSGGQVGRRSYPVGNGYIRGFARPKYGTAVKPDPAPETPSKPATGGKIKMKSYKLGTTVMLRKTASKTGKVIATLLKGQTIKFDDVVISQGYIWAVQPRKDGSKGYAAIGPIDPYGTIS